jgi:3-hydroxyisobutyrate dehydrogenase-like beta-hydroxyacid dehydrogenase
MNIGIVGTGLMGSQIALRLAYKGHKVTVFNRDKSKAEKLRRANASITLDVANQPSDIGSNCDIALICVKDYEAVSNVSFEKGGLIENPKADLVVIQCSTIAPDESRKIADLYSSKRIKIISVPILGGISAAERGELILIAAGASTDYDQSESILKDISKQVFYIGSDHGTASILKLAVNINISLISLALAEGLVFVKGNNIDPNIFVKIFNSTYFKTGISETKGPKIANDDYTTSFHLMNMVKDLNLALRTAHNSGLILPTTASAHAVYRASEALGLSNMDYTSVASFLLKLNGNNTFGLGGE